MMWTVPDALKLTEEQRRTLSSWVAARNTPQKVVFRARIVLLAAEGKANRRIAQELGTSRPSVILWRRRFQQGGTTALTEDRPGRGRKATISAARVKQIVEATLHSKPPAATHWSVRTMARAQHVSPATGATHLGCAWLSSPWRK
jgi:transposase